jgi:hypothetical protein
MINNITRIPSGQYYFSSGNRGAMRLSADGAGEVEPDHADDYEDHESYLRGGYVFPEKPETDYCHKKRAEPRPYGVSHAQVQTPEGKAEEPQAYDISNEHEDSGDNAGKAAGSLQKGGSGHPENDGNEKKKPVINFIHT